MPHRPRPQTSRKTPGGIRPPARAGRVPGGPSPRQNGPRFYFCCRKRLLFVLFTTQHVERHPWRTSPLPPPHRIRSCDDGQQSQTYPTAQTHSVPQNSPSPRKKKGMKHTVSALRQNRPLRHLPGRNQRGFSLPISPQIPHLPRAGREADGRRFANAAFPPPLPDLRPAARDPRRRLFTCWNLSSICFC